MNFSTISPRSLAPVYRRPRSALALAVVAVSLGACGGGGESEGEEEVSIPASAPEEAEAIELHANPVVGSTATACDKATGPVREVGPGRQYAKPSAAAAIARSGDVIKIQAGDYRGDVATWKVGNLTICGVGGRARLHADGKSAGGKAIWVVAAPDITIDSVEFHKAAVPDKNGAGIKMESKSGYLHVINSGFFDNQNGILTSWGNATLTIERSQFARNSNGGTDGQTHNLYVGAIDQLNVSSSYFHEARHGSNLKSRAKVNVVENSYLMDGANGPASYLADFSNGGKVVLRGNMFHKGPKAPNRVAIRYGAEGKKWTDNTLEMVHNTVVMTRANSTFLRVPTWAESVKLTANLLASTTGSDILIPAGEFPLASIAQRSNVAMRSALIPGAASITAPNFWPTAAGLPMTALQVRLDSSYIQDAPAPFATRAVSGKPPRAGALQLAP